MFLPVAKQMAGVASVFGGIDFWRLRPAPDLVATQPGLQSPARHVAAARTEARDLALVYVPQEKNVELALDALPPSPSAIWLNARTGEGAQARVTMRQNVPVPHARRRRLVAVANLHRPEKARARKTQPADRANPAAPVALSHGTTLQTMHVMHAKSLLNPNHNRNLNLNL